MFVAALLVFLLNLCCYCQAINVVVNCTWPCADSSQACIVTATSIQCTYKHNSQWVLLQPTQSPVFMGDIARRHTPCITSPNPLPYLPHETTSTQFNETKQLVINWPAVDSDRPLDEYLSDCESNAFCDLTTNICIDRLTEDSACESTNQCATGLLCIENRCTDVRLDDNEGAGATSRKVHTTIIVAVVVVAVLATISVAAIIYYRRKARVLKKNKDTGSPPPSLRLVTIQSVSPPSLPPPAIVIEPTPTMQQQHLQYQLHRQHAPSVDLKDETLPPPPYSP